MGGLIQLGKALLTRRCGLASNSFSSEPQRSPRCVQYRPIELCLEQHLCGAWNSVERRNYAGPAKWQGPDRNASKNNQNSLER